MNCLLIRFIVMVSAGLALLLPSPATAQDADILGVFFDESGTQTGTISSDPGQMVPFYLVLQNPGHGEGIHAWECIVEARSDAPIYLVGWQYRGGGVNFDQPPRLYVDLGTPLPAADSVVLATALAVVPDPATEVLFYLHSYDPPSLQDPPGYGYPVTTPLYRYGDEAYQPLGWSSGCESEPVARINDDGIDPVWGLDELPEEIPFGYVPAGETSYRSITLRNTGDVVLSGQLSIGGEGFRFRYGGPYWTDESKWFQIEPASHLGVELEVQSVIDEEYTGELTVTLCGEATTIVLSTQGPGLHCWVDPPLLDFGEIDLSYPHTLYRYAWIYNIGSLDLWIDITEDCPDFSATLQGGTDTPIPPGESRRLRVALDPSESGLRTCVIALGNDACADVTCTAIVAADIPLCAVTPEAWDYGEVVVGTMIPKTFSVRNAGGGLVEGQVMPPPDHPTFALMDGAEPFSLAHGEIHEFTVAFKPHAEGYRGCEIDVTGGCEDVSVEGTGIPYEESCTVEPATLDFGDVWIGLRFEHELVISNTGTTALTGDLQLNGLGETPPNAFTLSESGPFTLNPGDERTICVGCEPPSLGTLVGFVTTGLPGIPPVYLTARAIEVPGTCRHYENGDAEIISTLPGAVRDVAITGENACVVGDGFSMVDISNPLQARNVGGIGWLSGTALAVNEPGTCAFLTRVVGYGDGYHYWYDGYLSVVDIEDPTSPEYVTSLLLWGAGGNHPTRLCISGDYAYVLSLDWGWGSSVLYLVDISNPHEPTLVSPPEIDYWVVAIAISGQYAYTLTRLHHPQLPNLVIYDISDIENVEIVSSLLMDRAGRAIAIDGDLAYVADGDLTVVDVSDPTRPVVVGSVITPGESEDVVVDGDFVYVAEGESGIVVCGIADPSSPGPGSLLGAMDTPGSAGRIAVGSQFAYLADGEGGLHTIWQQCGTDDLAGKAAADVPVAELRLSVHPNPFNPQTTIVLEIPRPGAARVRIFDLRGRLTATLVDDVLPGGRHEVVWDGRDTAGRQLASGTYLCRLESPQGVRSQKLALIR